MQLTYAIVGTGALGGYYGAKLARSGKEVHFLLNSDYEHVKANGLRIDSVDGDFLLPSVMAYPNPSAMSPVDVVLVCLKTTSNHLLEELLAPLLHPNTLVILLQNGLAVEEAVARHFPQAQVAGALAFICSGKVGPGHIHHQDEGRIIVGAYRMDRPELLEQVSSDFLAAEVPCQLAPDLATARWQKLVWNVAFNGLSVVLNTTTDQILKNADSRTLAYELMLEVVAGAKANELPLTVKFADKLLEMTDRMVPYAPSMKLDHDARRPMEIDAIYETPVRHAMSKGYHMKKVEMLGQQLRFINRQNGHD